MPKVWVPLGPATPLIQCTTVLQILHTGHFQRNALHTRCLVSHIHIIRQMPPTQLYLHPYTLSLALTSPLFHDQC